MKIALAGDSGVGKSSLVTALVKDCWPERVQQVVTEIDLPSDVTLQPGVPTQIVDTASTPDKRAHLEASLRSAHVILLVYSIPSPTSFDRIPTYWLPYLRSLGIINVPVILVGNKIDQRTDAELTNEALEDELAPVMAEFKEVESCIETSVKEGVNVSEVFYYAQKAVLYPSAPLYDTKAQSLKEPCIAALKRIFRLCDSDKDYLLSDDELNDFQRRCFGVPLQEAELEGIKNLVSSVPLPSYYQRPPQSDHTQRPQPNDGPNRLSANAPRSSSSSGGSADASTSFSRSNHRNRKGSAASSSYTSHPHLQDGMLTLSGWLHLHTLFIQRGKLETTWQVLRSYGYSQDLTLSQDYLNPPSFTVPSDCSVELSPYGYSFLTDIFEAHDKDRDGALSQQELTELFATAPGGRHPWEDSDFPHTTVTDENGAVTLQGWLAQWSMTTLLDYKVTLANLAYLGYPNFILGGPAKDSGANAASDGPHHNHRHAHTSSINSIPPTPDHHNTSSSSSPSGYPSPPPTTTALTLTRRNPRPTFSSSWYSPSSSPPPSGSSSTKKKKKKGDPAERSVFLAYVVGAAGSGKTSLLRAMVGKRFDPNYRPTTRTQSVVAAIEQGGMEKYLVLQEFGSRHESESLRSHAKLASADVIIYVYDSSDTNSFSYISNLRQHFSSGAASRSSNSLVNLPCLFVATKTDQDLAQQRHEVQPDVYCKKLGLERHSPFNVTTLTQGGSSTNNVHDLYALVVQIAQDPWGMESIPGWRERAAARMGSVALWMGMAVVVGGVGVGTWVWLNKRGGGAAAGGDKLINPSSTGSGGSSSWWNLLASKSPAAAAASTRR